jgi:DNA-binding NtrC family response regulator
VKVLIVDDEELDLFINKKLLSLEHETAGFTSVKDTLEWAKNNDFDVAIIDYYLGPGVFANHVLDQLIAMKGRTFRSYVVSNYIDDKQVQELRNAGFTDVIYKPLTVEGFREKVNT